MHFSQLQYQPIAGPFFTLFLAALIVVAVLIQIRVLRYAYQQMGLSSVAATFLLVSSLLGSNFNIPIFELPAREVISGQEIDFFGMRYRVPMVEGWPGTIVAINVGGAVIPILTSFYLLARNRLWLLGTIATTGVALVCHRLALPVAGLGIALPLFVPAITTAVVALLLSRRHAAWLAYIGGSLGTLIGADLLNLNKVQGLGAPIMSIGGAGTFDGIFITGILAVLLAGLTGREDHDTPPPTHDVSKSNK